MDRNKWVAWAQELQFLSQCALTYCRDVYDIERFERIREISAEMVGELADLPVERVKDLFCDEAGYQTPKLETRAAIIEDGKILLVKERDGRWSMPGGWVDHDQSVRDNTVKEVWEEAGLEVRATRLVALHDRNRHNIPPYIHNICKVFVLCERLGGAFRPNVETVASGWFTPDELPPLAENRVNREQVLLCFRAAEDPDWKVEFD